MLFHLPDGTLLGKSIKNVPHFSSDICKCRNLAVPRPESEDCTRWRWRVIPLPTEAPTIPAGQQKSTCWLTNQPVTYSASPFASIRKITLFGKWPTPLGN